MPLSHWVYNLGPHLHFSPNNQPASRTWLRPPNLTRLLQSIWFGHTLQSRLQISRIRSTRLFLQLGDWLSILHSTKHQTKAGNIKSIFRAINASIIQGSGLGPVSLVFTACDLALFPPNILLKYADDAYLIKSSQFSPHPTGVRSCVAVRQNANNLKLNSSKSCEMVVHLPTNKP